MSQLLVRAAGTALVTLPASLAAGQCTDTLHAPDSAVFPDYGADVGQWGDDLVVGASNFGTSLFEEHGAVYVYESAPNGWVLAQKIEPSPPLAGRHFARSVAISGDTLLVGDPFADPATLSGAVYFFERTPSGFVLAQSITAGTFEVFGADCAIDGDTAIVSSMGSNEVRIFERDASGWSQTPSLLTSGRIVALDGDVAVVSEEWCDAASVVKVFERTAAGWVQHDLTASFALADDCFGAATAVEGDTILVGAPQSGNASSPAGPGAAYVYRRVATGWGEVARLTANDGKLGDRFGASVALSGARALIGASGDDDAGEDTGSVYLFELTSQGWREAAKLVPEAAPNRDFGAALALSPGAAFIADPRDPFGPGEHGSVQALPLDAGVRYCQSSPNSTGAAATISALGCASVALNELVLQAGPVPTGAGLFFYGDAQADLPFGNGSLCVGGAIHRLGILVMDDYLVHPLDVSDPPSVAGRITAGSTWYFQAWFRDTIAGGAGVDLSDALSILFGA